MKTITLLFILTSILFSQDNYELKLYEKLLPLLFQKKSVHIYTQDSDYRNLFGESTLIKISPNCEEADLIVGKKLDNLADICDDKPIFATSYRSFMHADNTFGAFYWTKGRPQIHFKLKLIKKYHLYLPQKLLRYAK